MEKKRDFKGVWIDRGVWLARDLTLQEKVFLVEIDSLDNAKHCYASNDYFARFFGLSKKRVSVVIQALIKKEYLKSEIDRNSGNKRTLTILKYPGRDSRQRPRDPIPVSGDTPLPESKATPIPVSGDNNSTKANNTKNISKH